MEVLTNDDKPLTTIQPYNYTASYYPLPPGAYNFIIRRPGDVTNPLKRQPVLLRPDTYVTFMVSEKSGKPAVDLLDDTIDPKLVHGLSRLTIRQFMPGARVVVAAAGGAATPELGYGEVATLDNLPNVDTVLNMRATTGTGPQPKQWNADADFTNARHATVLVVPDPYGRFRPRVSYDGQIASRPDPTPTPTPTVRP